MGGKRFSIKETLKEFPVKSLDSSNLVSTYCFVLPDEAALKELYQAQLQAYGEKASLFRYYIMFDTDSPEKEVELAETIRLSIRERYPFYTDSREGSRFSFLTLYGSLLFLGIFLGILFMMAAALMIYYKQISEGYEDKERFEIMQKVGLSRRELKRSIKSQVLMVFFLPLLVAGIHTAAAFNMVSKLLALLQLSNVVLFVLCSVVTFLLFSLFYGLIYSLTARTYYKIVQH